MGVILLSNKLVRLIKRIVKETTEDSKPANIIVGHVESVSPLRISINQTYYLSESMIYKTQKMDSLQEGVNVALLRKAGGQKYLVLDVIL